MPAGRKGKNPPRKSPLPSGAVRASLTYGGFIISPWETLGAQPSEGSERNGEGERGEEGQGEGERGKPPRSIVTHILELNPGGAYDWWPLRCLGLTGDPSAFQIMMLARVAGQLYPLLFPHFSLLHPGSPH